MIHSIKTQGHGEYGRTMKVLKFGGSSVADNQNINKVIDILVDSQKNGERLAVVVSALGGVTDDLVKLAMLASRKENGHEVLLKNICQRHNEVIEKMIRPKDRRKVLREISKKYDELEEAAQSIFLNGPSKSVNDEILSFGEQFSAYIISEAIKSRKILCTFIDVRTLIKTDDNFGEANVDIKNSYKNISKYFSENNQQLFIMGGFIASTKSGLTTTLGRGGSDYTASLVGAALNASVVEIWTDVDGLMTADPRKVKNAVSIPEISYEKAEEMANAGAKVIHPKTMKPARLKNIPIYIKNTFNPKHKGTKISNEKINGKIPVGILGATGMVGQQFICLLENHPWFTVTCVAASEKSAGKKYSEAVKGRWLQKKSIPKSVEALPVYSIEKDVKIIAQQVRFVFSAIDADKDFIKKIEEAYAEMGLPVVSNNSAHRWTPDVPMIMPEINIQHLDIIRIQQKKRGWENGFIVTKPNCSIQSYVPLLHAWKSFNPQKVIVSTYQAISGAGKTFVNWPEMIDNVIPFIGGEEEKSENEPKKIFGNIRERKFVFKNTPQISANCIRVPVADGHMAAINVQFKKKVSKRDLVKALKNFKNPLESLDLPSAPKVFLNYFEEPDRPQTRLDRDLEGGMGISIGRIREDSVLGWKCVALSHNTIRGAAGGSILTAELLVKKGYIK